MRLIEFQDFSKGKYIGLALSSQTKSNLQAYCEKNNIRNCPNDFHITLVKSNVDFPWKNDLPCPHIIHPKYELRKVQATGTLLVLSFYDKTLVERFWLAKNVGALAGKKPRLHLTLSYKFNGKLDILPKPDFPLVVEREYVEPLMDPRSARLRLGV